MRSLAALAFGLCLVVVCWEIPTALYGSPGFLVSPGVCLLGRVVLPAHAPRCSTSTWINTYRHTRTRASAHTRCNPPHAAAHAQVPDADKRRRADFVIDTGCSLEATEAAVAALVEALAARGGGGAYAHALALAAAAVEGGGTGKQ